MRYEKKYETYSSVLNELKVFLKAHYFKEHYESRIVSSIYFDTIDFKNYVDAESGQESRIKVRERFYNMDPSSALIEIKKKESDLGFKEYYDLKEIDNEENIKRLIFNKNGSFLKIPNKIFTIYFPIVYVEYKRNYFISSDKELRITFDKSINFSRIKNKENSFELDKKFKFNSSVIEIKYNRDYNPNKVFVNSLFERFNLTISKFSKYCNAIEALF